MKRILIADPDPAFRRALATLLVHRLEIQSIEEAADTGTMLHILESTPADVLLLNWSMHGVSGPAICVLLRNTYPNMKIVLLSSNPEDEPAAKAAGGAFLCKGASPEETLKILGEAIKESTN